jgi:hypothetical protein
LSSRGPVFVVAFLLVTCAFRDPAVRLARLEMKDVKLHF